MTVRESSKLLENMWLPNGDEALIVSISTLVDIAATKPRHMRPNARTAVCQGEGFPRFSNVPSHIAPGLPGVNSPGKPGAMWDRRVLTLSRNRSVVKIRPR